MSLVINSYQTGRPSIVDVATAIEHLPTFHKLLALGFWLSALRKPGAQSLEPIPKFVVWHVRMTPK
jgi:hypothetical protein